MLQENQFLQEDPELDPEINNGRIPQVQAQSLALLLTTDLWNDHSMRKRTPNLL